MIHVKGEVVHPGSYPLVTGMTATDAINAAGGYSRFAAGIVVLRGTNTVVRKRGIDWRDHPEKWNVTLEHDDIVVGQRMR